MTVFYGTQRVLENMLSTIIQVDSNMIELKRVMSESTDFDKMLQESLNIANELGNKLDDIQKTMIGFAQAGFDEEDVINLTKVATIMSNISELSADEAMDTLTSAMIQFKLSSEEAIQVADKINEVSNNFPYSFANIANALERAGGVAVTFGVSMDDLISHIVAMGASTREAGRTIGNSLETIYSRIGTIPEAIEQLRKIGIDSANQSAAKTISLLAEKWNQLSDAQRQNISLAIAGRDQLSRFTALMNNYSMAISVNETILNSQGSAMEENSKYLQSLEARINKLKNAWAELSLSVGDAFLTEGFIAVLTALTDLTKAGTDFVKSFGVLPTVLATVGISSLVLSRNIRTLVFGMVDLLKYIPMLGTHLTKLDTIMQTGSKTAKFFALSLRGILASTGIGLLAVGAGIVIEKLTTAYVKHKEEQEKLEQQNKKIVDSWINHREEINKLLSEYNKLNQVTRGGKVFSDVEQEQRYFEITRQIGDLLPNLIQSIDEKGNVHLKNADAIKRELEYTEKLVEKQKELSVAEAEKQIIELLKNISNAQKEAEKIRNNLARGEEYVPDIGFIKYSDEEIKKFEIRILELEKSITDSYSNINEIVSTVTKNILDSSKVIVEESTLKQLDEILSGLNFKRIENPEKIIATAKSIADAIKGLVNSSKTGSLQGLSNYQAQLRLLLQQMGSSPAAIDRFINALLGVKDATDSATQSTVDYKKAQSDINEDLKTYSDALQDLASAYATLNKGEQLSYDTIIDLIQKYPELTSALVNEHGQLTLNKQAVEALMNAKEAEFKSSLIQRRTELEQMKTAFEAKMQMYSGEIAALRVLNKEKFLWNARSIEEAQFLESKFNEYKSIVDQINGLSALINANLTKGFVASATKTKTKTSSREIEPYKTDKFAQAIDELDLKLKQSQYRLEQYNETSEQYRKELQNQIALLKQKQSLTHQEANRLRAENAQLQKRLNTEKLTLEKRNELLKKLDENQQKLNDLASSWWDYQNQINDLDFKIFQSKHNAIVQTVEETSKRISKEIDDIQDAMDSLDSEDTNYYSDKMTLLTNLIDKYEEQKRQIQENIIKLQELNKEVKVGSEAWQQNQSQIEKWLDELESADDSIRNLQKELMDMRRKLADDIVNVYKEVYEKQKDIALRNIDYELDKLEEEHNERIKQLEEQRDKAIKANEDELDSFEKRHQTIMDQLDEELAKYEEIINQKLKQLDLEEDEETYEKRLAELQKERQDILNQISVLSLDDSLESRAKVAELTEQLSQKEQEISELQSDRERELRRQALQDQLENFRKEIEEKKKVENDKYEETRERLEKEKEEYDDYYEHLIESENERYENKRRSLEQERKDVEYHYNELINNEREFSKIREAIINGHVESVKSKLTQFIEDFKRVNKDAAREIGLSYEELLNLIEDIERASSSIDKYGKSTSSSSSSKSSSSSSSSKSSSSSSSSSDPKKYGYGPAYGDAAKANDERLKADSAYRQSEFDRTLKVIEERKKAGLDTSVQEKYLQKIFDYMSKYHEGGIVGEKTSKMGDLINKIFNLKPDEQVIKAIQGEVMIPPKNFANGIRNLQNIVSSIQQKESTPPILQIDKLIEIGNISKDTNINIKQIVNEALNELQRRLKPWGVNFR